ncbi:hypothetical protein QCD79_33075, partial [Pseudomonas quasicaspiana]|nr:hypothetical protein [Pseudomonas quasicaspiana]
AQSGQPYLRIDPLKIKVASVTPLMSYAFAQRHKILAVRKGVRHQGRDRSDLDLQRVDAQIRLPALGREPGSQG